MKLKTEIPCILLTAWSLNHWTAREVLGSGGFYVDL